MKTVWQMKRAALAGDPGTRMLDTYLSEGWEPFAVTRDSQGEEHIHLRKQVRMKDDE